MGNTYSIAITYCDDEQNRLVELGGAAWKTQEEWESAWDSIPASNVNDPARCTADKLDENDNIVEDRCISRETVEILLSKPISQLIEEASIVAR